MRKFTLFLVLLLTASLFAIEQVKLIVHLNDDAPVEYVAIEVDSITFSDVYVEPDTLDTLENYENGYEYVDLGLPSGTKWATMNVGADSPEDYGDYFAWGETYSKSTYGLGSYKWCNGSSSSQTKYCTDSKYGIVDNKTTLELSDDAANASWGGSWRMPTNAELEELIDNCTWTWTTQNGVKGYKVTSKTNGNSIFLPAAGYRNYSDLRDAGYYGYYWSSSLRTSNSKNAYHLSFDSGNVYSIDNYRHYGQSIRPVLRDVE